MREMLRWLLPLFLLPLFAACDDDPPYGPPPPPPADFDLLASQALMAPAITPAFVDSSDPDDMAWFREYNDVVTILNSRSDVNYFFTPAQLADYPDLTYVDFRRFSVVIYTRYFDFLPDSYDWQWGYNYARPETDYWLDVIFYPSSEPLYRGEYALGQVAIMVDKIYTNSIVGVSMSVY